MIVESIIHLIVTIVFLIWYLSKKNNCIKTVGICKKNLGCSRGSKGMFEYEIDGVKHYNSENTKHITTCKIGKEYTIYVKKYNHEKFVSIKVLMDLLIFTILEGIFTISYILEVVYEALY